MKKLFTLLFAGVLFLGVATSCSDDAPVPATIEDPQEENGVGSSNGGVRDQKPILR